MYKLTHLGIEGYGDVFNENVDSEYITRLKIHYFDQIEHEDKEDLIGYKDVELVELYVLLINTTEMINDGVFGFVIFDDFSGDLAVLYENFIGDSEKNWNEEAKIWKPFVEPSGYAGNIIYIETITKHNGGTNVHIREAIEDCMRRFSHSEGITTFCKTQENKHEEEMFALLQHMNFKINPLDSQWIFTENDRIRKKEKLKAI